MIKEAYMKWVTETNFHVLLLPGSGVLCEKSRIIDKTSDLG